ncbi:hypothetical protein HZS_1845, partial [Henneguya salminicola]
MSSKKFEDTEDELMYAIEYIKKLHENKMSEPVEEKKRSIIKEIQQKIDKAFILVNTIEEEVLIAPGSLRGRLANKVSSYNKTLYDLQSSLSQTNIISERSKLLGYNSLQNDLRPDDALNSLEMLNKISSSVDRSIQVSAQTGRTFSDQYSRST